MQGIGRLLSPSSKCPCSTKPVVEHGATVAQRRHMPCRKGRQESFSKYYASLDLEKMQCSHIVTGATSHEDAHAPAGPG